MPSYWRCTRSTSARLFGWGPEALLRRSRLRWGETSGGAIVRYSRALFAPEERGGGMKWIKPEFEIIDLCTEVTLYLYNR